MAILAIGVGFVRVGARMPQGGFGFDRAPKHSVDCGRGLQSSVSFPPCYNLDSKGPTMVGVHLPDVFHP